MRSLHVKVSFHALVSSCTDPHVFNLTVPWHQAHRSRDQPQQHAPRFAQHWQQRTHLARSHSMRRPPARHNHNDFLNHHHNLNQHFAARPET
jgi:hypothetical protein